MPVLTLVTAAVAPERRSEVAGPFGEVLAAGLPPGIRQTFLLDGVDGRLGIATVWETREDLEAMRASGEEPLARRLLREAGGEPVLEVFEIALEAGSGRGPVRPEPHDLTR